VGLPGREKRKALEMWPRTAPRILREGEEGASTLSERKDLID